MHLTGLGSSVLGGRLWGALHPSFHPADPPSLQTISDFHGIHYHECLKNGRTLLRGAAWNQVHVLLYVLVAWDTRHAVADLCRLRNVCAHLPSVGRVGARRAGHLEVAGDVDNRSGCRTDLAGGATRQALDTGCRDQRHLFLVGIDD